MMQKCFFIIFSLHLFISTLSASVSEGKEIYTKQCLHCHLRGKALSSHKPAKTWQELFALVNGSNALATLHLSLNDANASWDYFKSKKYTKETKHLQDFMLKYSLDRGKHNSCN